MGNFNYSQNYRITLDLIIIFIVNIDDSPKQTTAYYIQDSLKGTSAKISKLAQGLPVGGEIESLDDGTLYSAFKNRKRLNSDSD